MKFKPIPLLLFATAAFLALPAWAGPYSSKFQNAQPTDNTAFTPAETGPHHKHMKKCCAKGMNHADMKAKCCAKGNDHPGMVMRHPDMHRAGMKHFMQNMSDEDRARFKGIHEKLSKNPDVQAARAAVKNADTPEAKRAAFKKLHEVKRAAMSDEDRAFVDGLRQKAKDNKACKKCAS